MDSETRKALKEIKTDIRSLKKDIGNYKKDTSQRFNEAKKNIKDYKEETIRHFDVAAENIHQDVANANKDEISLIIQKQDNLEKRVQRIEQKVSA